MNTDKNPDLNPCNPWLKFVDLCSEDEVALSEPIDLMRPDRDLRLSPTEANVRMMALLLRQIPDTVHKSLCFPKV